MKATYVSIAMLISVCVSVSVLVACAKTEVVPINGAEIPNKSLYVYVFNDETQLWDRARKETLIKADCAKIRLLNIQEEPK